MSLQVKLSIRTPSGFRSRFQNAASGTGILSHYLAACI